MKTTVYEVVTARILEALAAGTVPWRRTWKTVDGNPGRGHLPCNLVSRKPYRGVNLIVLWSAGFASPYFVTFNQARQLGGSVKKGSHGLPIIFWTVYDGKNTQTGKAEKRFVLRYFTVFSVEQCEGLDKHLPRASPEGAPVAPVASPIDSCEAVVASYRNPPTVRHGGDRACYSPAADAVQMPPASAFDSPEAYYSTLFHELGHSTGAKSRLNRKGIADRTTFGDHAYTFEELVAECTAAFLCAEAGIANAATLENTAAYLANWARTLKDQPRWIVEAAGQAAKAADLILARGARAEEGSAEAA